MVNRQRTDGTNDEAEDWSDVIILRQAAKYQDGQCTACGQLRKVREVSGSGLMCAGCILKKSSASPSVGTAQAKRQRDKGAGSPLDSKPPCSPQHPLSRLGYAFGFCAAVLAKYGQGSGKVKQSTSTRDATRAAAPIGQPPGVTGWHAPRAARTLVFSR